MQHLANPNSAQELIQWGQWRRQKQQELSGQLLGKDKAAVLAMWGKPDHIDTDLPPGFHGGYVGYYENADPHVLQEAEEEWTYIFPRKRILLISDRMSVYLYFKDDKVVFVGL